MTTVNRKSMLFHCSFGIKL